MTRTTHLNDEEKTLVVAHAALDYVSRELSGLRAPPAQVTIAIEAAQQAVDSALAAAGVDITHESDGR